MSLFSRNYLGLDIGAAALRGASFRRSGSKRVLTGGRSVTLPDGLLRPALRDLNVQQEDALVSKLRELLDPFADGEERISLSIPDGAGRLVLHDVETSFKSKAEGIEVLKWQLKQSLPAAPQETRIDYQILQRDENGRYRLAIAVIAQKVLDQYETLLNRAGYHALVVDLHSLNLLNYYQMMSDPGDDYILVSVEGESMVLQYFHHRLLSWHRHRDVEGQPQRVFQEVNRSLAGVRDVLPGIGRAKVLLHSDWDDTQPLLEALTGAFEKEVVLLDPKLETLATAPLSDRNRQVRGLVAAAGAALRMM